MAKKEKAPKEPKPKKEKKAKEPKPKKEKKPREPKPKKEKKPRVQKTAPEGAEGKAKKGGGKKKLLLILLPVVLLAAAAAVLLLTGVLGGGKGGDAQEDGGEEIGEAEDTEGDRETGEEAELPEGDGDAEGTEGEAGEGGELEEIPATPAPVHQPSMTTQEIGVFIESLSPSVLGLEGEDMSAYDVFPSEGVSYMRDPETGQNLTCSRIQIFSKGEVSGTNDIEGVYLLTRGGVRRLFRYDAEQDLWTELLLS